MLTIDLRDRYSGNTEIEIYLHNWDILIMPSRIESGNAAASERCNLADLSRTMFLFHYRAIFDYLELFSLSLSSEKRFFPGFISRFLE